MKRISLNLYKFDILCFANGETTSSVAAQTGITQSSLWAAMHGRIRSPKIVARVAAYFNTSPENVVGTVDRLDVFNALAPLVKSK